MNLLHGTIGPYKQTKNKIVWRNARGQRKWQAELFRKNWMSPGKELWGYAFQSSSTCMVGSGGGKLARSTKGRAFWELERFIRQELDPYNMMKP